LLGTAPFLAFAELLTNDSDVRQAESHIGHYAQRVREFGDADIGLAIHARQTRDTHVRIGIALRPNETIELKRTAFQAGEEGRRRAALAACAALWETLRQT
jgi:hypothetical protein